MAEVKATSNQIKATSTMAQPILHPDYHPESPRHFAGAFGTYVLHHEQTDTKEDAPPISQHLLRRLRRGYLLQYERDEEERDEARSNVRQTSFMDLIKREECPSVHHFTPLFVTDSLAIVFYSSSLRRSASARPTPRTASKGQKSYIPPRASSLVRAETRPTRLTPSPLDSLVSSCCKLLF